jgi:hypothetical protein
MDDDEQITFYQQKSFIYLFVDSNFMKIMTHIIIFAKYFCSGFEARKSLFVQNISHVYLFNEFIKVGAACISMHIMAAN